MITCCNNKTTNRFFYCLISHDRYLIYVELKFTMSERNKDNEDIETAQKNQKKVGAAENDPETTGPAENLREEAAEMVDKDEDSNEPA
jgi:hypothetical protein